MASYLPPIPLKQGLFNPANFQDPQGGLTFNEANKYFLRFPTAQGTETFSSAVISSAVITGKLSTTNTDAKSLVYGYQTTDSSGSGLHNTAFGYQAGQGYNTLTTGGGNSAFGAQTMPVITTTATNNTAIGHNSLSSLTSGSRNTAVGTIIPTSTITTGTDNTLVGYNAKPSGNFNNTVVIGASAKGGSTGDVIVGASAGINLNGALRTIAIGNEAIGGGGGRSLVSGGNDNVCIGLNSGKLLNGGALPTTCAENVALGSNTLGGGGAGPNTTGYANTCIGFQCGRNITSASYNTGIGWKSLGGSELGGLFTGTDNMCFGIQAGARLTTGSNNAFIGANSGGLNTTGEKNVYIGGASGADATGNSENTFLGYRAGKALTSGNRNTALGAEIVITNTITEATAIGYGATATASQTITLGRVGTDSVRLNKITPMYSSLSFGTGDIGYKYTVAMTFATPTIAATIATTPTLPIGVWVCNVNMWFTGTWGSSWVTLTDTSPVFTYGVFPIVASSNGVINAALSGSAIISITSAKTISLFYNGLANSLLTLVPDGGFGAPSFTITRIA